MFAFSFSSSIILLFLGIFVVFLLFRFAGKVASYQGGKLVSIESLKFFKTISSVIVIH